AHHLAYPTNDGSFPSSIQGPRCRRVSRRSTDTGVRTRPGRPGACGGPCRDGPVVYSRAERSRAHAAAGQDSVKNGHDLVKRRGWDEDAGHAKLYDEAGHLRRLVDDLQELSRAAARQMPVVLQPVPPAALIQAALDRLAPQFAEKGVELCIAAASQLPPVLADEDRAVQVLTNLLTNALRYTPALGRVEVVSLIYGPWREVGSDAIVCR